MIFGIRKVTMKLTLIFVVVLACFSSVFASSAPSGGNANDMKALKQACKELGGGAKIRFEIDLSGACEY
jgi:hypothetical protein